MPKAFSPAQLFNKRAISQLILLLGAALMVLPFLYMVGTSFKPPPEVIAWPPTILPRQPTLENYASQLQNYIAGPNLFAIPDL